ncbi:Fc.00g021550.m01.CDS01 [Cosmosporella sp. VM-42]
MSRPTPRYVRRTTNRPSSLSHQSAAKCPYQIPAILTALMPNHVDKSLLERLQALRGGSATPEQSTPEKINADLIERAKTPTREDALAARLKSLRSQDGGSTSSKTSPQTARSPALVASSATPLASTRQPRDEIEQEGDEDVDALFQTDDQTLEELLGDVGADEGFAAEPDDAKVKALLEELSQSIPKDDESEKKNAREDERDKDSDDSDGEEMTREVDEVIAKFRDEIELEIALGKDEPEKEKESEGEDEKAAGEAPAVSDLALPEVPSNLEDIPSSQSARAGSADIDDITARLAALRAPSKTEDDLSLPEVPSSKPSGKPIKRLTTKTNYTDDDMDGWCTVCLEDATLRCLGCDDDVYCTRCWREMHIGPSAGFDERSHKAVHFTKDKKKEKKVALGA